MPITFPLISSFLCSLLLPLQLLFSFPLDMTPRHITRKLRTLNFYNLEKKDFVICKPFYELTMWIWVACFKQIRNYFMKCYLRLNYLERLQFFCCTLDKKELWIGVKCTNRFALDDAPYISFIHSYRTQYATLNKLQCLFNNFIPSLLYFQFKFTHQIVFLINWIHACLNVHRLRINCCF